MGILAFETSAKAASVALLEGGNLLAESYQNAGLTHSRTILVMAEHLLQSCELTPQDVEAVAVAMGPGSFTGCASAWQRPGLRLGPGAAPLRRIHPWRPWRGGWELEGLICPVMGRPAQLRTTPLSPLRYRLTRPRGPGHLWRQIWKRICKPGRAGDP